VSIRVVFIFTDSLFKVLEIHTMMGISEFMTNLPSTRKYTSRRNFGSMFSTLTNEINVRFIHCRKSAAGADSGITSERRNFQIEMMTS